MKRFIAIALSAIALSGCTTHTSKLDTGQASNDETAFQAGDNDDGRSVFTGRYMETDITPPQSGNEISHLWLTDNGLICCSDNQYYITSDNGGSWTDLDISWTVAMECDSFSILFVEDNGTIWLQASTLVDDPTQGNPYQQRLWKVDPNRDLARIDISEDLYSMEKIRPLPGEKVLIQYYTLESESDSIEENAGAYIEENVGVFDITTGRLLYRVEYEPFQNQGVVCVSDGWIYFFRITGGDSIGFSAKKFDSNDGSELDSYPNILPRDGFYFRNQINGPIAVAHDSLYYINQQLGISRVALGGSISEVILEYDRYSCQGFGMDVYDFLIDEQSTLYVVSRSVDYNPSSPDRLLKYAYGPDAPYDVDNRNQNQGTTFYTERKPGGNQRSIYAALPDGEIVTVVENAHQIQAENDHYIVFTRSSQVEYEKQTRRAALTLHYYDKAKNQTGDIFTDTWEEWSPDQRMTAGVVLGAINADREWRRDHTDYQLDDSSLEFYVSVVEDNRLERYRFGFTTGNMERLDAVDRDE